MMETNESTLDRSNNSFLASHTRATSRAQVSSFRSRTGKAGAGINLESGNSGYNNEGDDYDTSKQKIRPLLARATDPLTRLLSLIRSGNPIATASICVAIGFFGILSYFGYWQLCGA